MQDLRVIKIVVADGRKVVANAIAKVLHSMAGFQVVGLAKSGEEMVGVLESCTPDIVVIDIDMPGSVSGLEVLRQIHRKLPQIRIIVLTNLLNQASVHDAFREGAMSYMLKYSSTDELVNAIRSADQGIPTLSPEVTRILIQEISTPNGYQLTSREREVLQLLAEGLNNHEIARHLYVSLSTVQFHVSNILNKLGVHNRTEAVMFAFRHKLAS